MKLIYLSEDNLRDSFFIKDLVNNFLSPGPWWVIHAPFNQSVKDTKFVTRRLSSLMSDALVINHAFSGDQRSIISEVDQQLALNTTFLNERLTEVKSILLSPVIKKGNDLSLVSPAELIRSMQKSFPIEETILFPKNPKSPLAVQKHTISSEDDFGKLSSLYEEELETLKLALEVSPASLATPVNFAR